MLFNIANSLEQCYQQNIVQYCFDQLGTSCSFWLIFCCVVYVEFSLCTNPAKLYNSMISFLLDDEIVVKATAVVLQVMEA